MIRRYQITAIAVAGLVALPAWAINKCKSHDGSTTYQEAPCTNGPGQQLQVQQSARPASTAKPSNQDPAATANTASSEKKAVEAMSRDRRIREINSDIADAENAIARRNDQMTRELDALKTQKSYAKNNLAGATYQQSLSTEMQAVATKYKALNDIDIERIKSLRLTLDQLKSAQ